MTCLPVDSYTTLGLLLMLATLLPATSFAADGISECVRVLQTLEEHMMINEPLQLLPHAAVFVAEVQENQVLLAQLKAILEELGLSWSRLALPSLVLICFHACHTA